MRVRLVVRLLSASQTLLAWGELWAEARGDQALWPLAPLVTVGDTTGTATLLSVHWPDLHVQAARVLSPSVSVQSGTVLSFAWKGEPVMRFATDTSVPLVPVTVRARRDVVVPLGALGAG